MGSRRIYSALEMFQRENSLPSIPSFSQSLDGVIGDKGIKLGSLVELIGLPGTGKTQLCLQLCASVQIPRLLGGLDAEALYIDTNTNFTAHRFREILSATISRCRSLLCISNGVENSPSTIEQNGLRRLHYVNAFGLLKFCAFMHRLPKFLDEHPNIRLIAIDSITFPFKEEITPKQRTGLLFRLMSDLQRVAIEKQIGVVLTNEMSTRVGLGGVSGVVGALGDAWAHRCNARVLLCSGVTPDARHALLLKASHADMLIGYFQITREGIRDVEAPT